MRSLLLFLFISLFSISCGFHKLNTDSYNSFLSRIKIDEVKGEQDYLLKRYIQETFHLNNNVKKTISLKVSVNKSIVSSIIKADNTITGQNIIVNATYSLHNLTNNKLIKSGNIKIIGDSSSIYSPLATEANLEKAYSDILMELARVLKMRVSIALKS